MELSYLRPAERGEASLCASPSTKTELASPKERPDVESHIRTSVGVASGMPGNGVKALIIVLSLLRFSFCRLPSAEMAAAHGGDAGCLPQWQLTAFPAEASEATPPLLVRKQRSQKNFSTYPGSDERPGANLGDGLDLNLDYPIISALHWATQSRFLSLGKLVKSEVRIKLLVG